MSDNIETETVRKVYCFEDPDGEYYFDKWLSKLEAQNYDRGAYNERHAIIKLLDNLADDYRAEWQFGGNPRDDAAFDAIERAIALIKGENE